MGKSYAKKYRYCRTDSMAKRYAIKLWRRLGLMINGNAYKRFYQSWNINDGGRAKPIPKINKDWAIKARRK